ncbi:MAG: N-formylglutamate amidohydrolase [Alphaproteobacteria bacterium]|jgi:N-formylglutamate amidohydrolase|nr:N-formylglutamate amidohydrolase [Alphaproteobacteria bacterium]MBT5859666.1 N-formylglutamate amidohydrolase [Alphaproteobacteria bacterium]
MKADHTDPAINGDDGALKPNAPFEILAPAVQTVPMVFVSAHSGRDYEPDFVETSRLDQLSLRRSEDSFVDELFAGAPDRGAPMLRAHFPRVYLDPNREPWELDPAMFEDALPEFVNTSSLRVAGGLGTIARVVTNGAEVYQGKLKFSEAERRIKTLYIPFHETIQDLLALTVQRFATAVLIDCHSMPSFGGPMDRDPGTERADMVLGDRFGTSCAKVVTDTVEEVLTKAGYRVDRNDPYAGGFTTRNYGRPDAGVHALQIEVKRSLYMDEDTIERLPELEKITATMNDLISTLASIDHAQLL